jgi:penicillin-binding protein 1A
MAKDKSTSQVLKKRARKSRRGRGATIIRWFLLVFIFTVISGVIGVAGVYFYLSKNLPEISTLKDYRPSVITTIYSDDNRKIAEFFRERRIVIPLSQMSPMLKNAFIAAEDARFYNHKGIDILSIIRAFFKNIEAGAIVQGGSTITQQVAKSFFFNPPKKLCSQNKGSNPCISH